MPIKIVAKKKSKKDPFRADKTESLNKDFSKRTAKANQEAMKKVTSGLKKAVKAHTGQAKMLSSIKLKKGGKVVKMRGGGAATRGMNFNRGY